MKKYGLYEHAGKVPYQKWKDDGIAVPIFDKDGTLSHANRLDFVDEVIDELAAAQLPDIYAKIAIASNNHDHTQVEAFAGALRKKLGVGVLAVSRAEGYRSKPHPDMGLVIAHEFGVAPSEVGVIGDRLFTDVKFGRNIGAGAIALCAKVGDGDARWVPTLRVIERGMTDIDKARGAATLYTPPIDQPASDGEVRPQAIGRTLYDAIERALNAKRDNKE